MNLHSLLIGVQIDTTIVEINVSIFSKIKVELQYDPSFSLLTIYSEQSRPYHRYLHPPCFFMVFAGSFTIAKTEISLLYQQMNENLDDGNFSSTYTEIEMSQKMSAWPLCKDGTQFHEAFHILSNSGVVLFYYILLFPLRRLFSNVLQKGSRSRKGGDGGENWEEQRVGKP